MATKKNTYKTSNTKQTKKKTKTVSAPTKINIDFSFLADQRLRMSVGLLFMFFSLFLLLAIFSYLFTGKADQSVVESLSFGKLIRSGLEVQNWLGLTGAGLAHIFVYNWFGVSSFLVAPTLFVVGYKMVFMRSLFPLQKMLSIVLFAMVWMGILLGYIEIKIASEEPTTLSFLVGRIGFQLAYLLNSFTGFGTPLFLILSAAIFSVYYVRSNAYTSVSHKFKEKMGSVSINLPKGIVPSNNATQTKKAEKEFKGTDNAVAEEDSERKNTSSKKDRKETTKKTANNVGRLKKSWNVFGGKKKKESTKKETTPTFSVEDTGAAEIVQGNDVGTSVTPVEKFGEEKPKEEVKKPLDLSMPVSFGDTTDPSKNIKDAVETVKVEDFDTFDPTLELGSYKFPQFSLLDEVGDQKVKVTQQELNENKDRIVKTLNDFKIGITSIKATIGPTVTLYEIVPDAGIKISRIRNLEDDIALSLAALGIRIIAPIPGKGTIGIEVPNKNREMVPIRAVLANEKFKNANKELPIALGKTISNEVFVTDLTKMPHLLMAGATGQGKSVGLNVILSSLIYKKHPAELKMVLVDPKKVELSLFNKIERHFLATLPDTDEPILTDTSKVVTVLNSLCVEMDLRYNLLKEAGCRNIKEYNSKFKARRLNPEKGHRFLPYIVLVVDELADLMMTAGKEVELPIARLAQLARAIGIHLIIATQRPSVDVITGIIKANFPARLSFRVTSKIDSRTILDTGGAEQLIGMGDMLLSNGSEIIRLQCAFVDTPEVERLCDFVANQKGYETSYQLPEYEAEASDQKTIDLNERDEMFESAARLLVTHQQGSTSLIQRKLSLGYNRAGRIIDQLEAAGIVGPFEGSKARQVLVHDEYALEQLLNGL